MARRKPDPDKTPNVLNLHLEALAPAIEACLPLGTHYMLILYRPVGSRVYASVEGSGVLEDQLQALRASLAYLSPPDA